MKNNKKKLVMGILGGIIVIGLIVFFFLGSNSSDNFIKLNYNEFKEKIDNNDSFVLCVSRTTCSHCNDYKPKLKEVSKKYNIKIYYTEINEFSNSELDYFKDNFGFEVKEITDNKLILIHEKEELFINLKEKNFFKYDHRIFQ